MKIVLIGQNNLKYCTRCGLKRNNRHKVITSFIEVSSKILKTCIEIQYHYWQVTYDYISS